MQCCQIWNAINATIQASSKNSLKYGHITDSSSPKFTKWNSLFHLYFAPSATTPPVSLNITSSLHFVCNILTILMISVSIYFYSTLLPTVILQLFCGMSTLFATFHWTQCLYELLGPHNSSNAMSEKLAVFPQTRGTSLAACVGPHLSAVSSI